MFDEAREARRVDADGTTEHAYAFTREAVGDDGAQVFRTVAEPGKGDRLRVFDSGEKLGRDAAALGEASDVRPRFVFARILHHGKRQENVERGCALPRWPALRKRARHENLGMVWQRRPVDEH